MARRANGEGHIKKRPDGRWFGVITVELPDGTTKRVKREGKSRAVVVEKLEQVRQRLRGGASLSTPLETVGAYLPHWLDTVFARRGRPKSVETYRKVIENYITPRLGSVRLEKLTVPRVRQLFAQLEKEGYHPRTLKLTRAVLSSALAQALDDGLLTQNVCDRRVKLPQVPPSPAKALTPEQARAVLEAARADRLGVAVRLALLGLRRGEICGLRLEDLQLDAKQPALIINGTITSVVRHKGERGELVYGPPKTAKSRRRVPLNAATVAAIRWHLGKRAAEQRAMAWEDGPYLLRAAQSGGPVNPETLDVVWRRIAKAAGLDAFRLHDCRHSAASFLIAENVHPKLISSYLGHSTIGITMDLYGHLMPGALDEAAELLGGVLDAPPPAGPETRQEEA